MNLRHEWFREGARTFRAAQRLLGQEHMLPPGEDLYACPLCLTSICRIGAVESRYLTFEDAPPKSVGGRPLALTCQPCNNNSGTHFDAHAEKEHRLLSFLTSEGSSPMNAEFSVGGIVNRGKMHGGGAGGFFLENVEKNNNRADVERFDQELIAGFTVWP
ncbi:hypothetical protein [Streptomyces sp. NPDC048277]|uniref:hypothetical protein n=1 Tax=Streptomyces sp. NPDC048277 TaxID=3155027 RepID=UPI0033C04110